MSKSTWEERLEKIEEEYPMALENWRVEDWKKFIREIRAEALNEGMTAEAINCDNHAKAAFQTGKDRAVEFIKENSHWPTKSLCEVYEQTLEDARTLPED